MMVRTLMTTVMLTMAVGASAQQAPAPTPAQPLIVEQIHQGWLFSPDVRATDLETETGALAGGYIGRIYDDTWAIGGGAYFLTNRDDDFKVMYGGPVVEWLVRTDRRIGFGVRSLLGFGSATLPVAVSDVFDPRLLARSHRTRSRRPGDLGIYPADATVAVRDDFLVAEPQVNVMVNLSRRQRIVFGLGYRVTGSAPWHGDALNGVSGSIAFQFGGGR